MTPSHTAAAAAAAATVISTVSNMESAAAAEAAAAAALWLQAAAENVQLRILFRGACMHAGTAILPCMVAAALVPTCSRQQRGAHNYSSAEGVTAEAAAAADM
jgi:hypothetical protein